MYWKQRGKSHWLREGDRNTSFFHSKASARRKMNWIHGLVDKQGTWQENKIIIQKIAVDHFCEMFTSIKPRVADMQRALDAIEPRVTPEINQALLQPFTAEEVTFSVFSMFPLKSPGPDGIPVLFYQKYWHVIRDDIISCSLAFLNSHEFLPHVNYTHIILIPKCHKPKYMPDFRPISLGNVI